MVNGSLQMIGQIAPPALGGIFLVAAALHDVAARTVPNWTSVGLLALGLILRAADGQLTVALSAAFLVLAATALCWKRGYLGGGDVKLLVAAAVFVPPGHIADMLVATALAGGGVSLVYLIGRSLPVRMLQPIRTRSRRQLVRILHAEWWRLRRGGPLPYASAIAAGTIFVIFAG